MKKLLLGLGALCLAGVAAPAMAQGWGGYNYGYSQNYGYGGYAATVRQHVRACRAHQRLHENLDMEHAMEHQEGFADRLDHADAHDELDEAHDQFHDEHDVNNCGSWQRQYYRMLAGPSSSRGYRSWGFGF